MSSEKGKLSQEEIDSLINSDLEEKNQDLTQIEKDVIGEINEIAMNSAATSLFTLLNKKVNIESPKVKLSSFNKETSELKETPIIIKVEYKDGLKGNNFLVFNSEDAAIIADLMMGGSGENIDEDSHLDEIHLSALGEAVSQMMGSAATSISNILNSVVNIKETVPLTDIKLEGIEDKYFEKRDQLVISEFNLKIANLIDSSFKQLASLEFTKNMIKILKKENNEKNENKKEHSSYYSEQQPGDEKSDQVENDKTAAQVNSNQQKGSPNKVDVQKAQFPKFGENEKETLPQNMDLLRDVPLTVTVRLGKTKMTISEVLDLGEGSIIELDKLAGELVDLFVNGKLIAKGEVVVIDENFGFRVKDIVSPAERISNL